MTTSPETVTITKENALAWAEDIDWQLATGKLLNDDQRKSYENACQEAYDEVCNALWEATE